MPGQFPRQHNHGESRTHAAEDDAEKQKHPALRGGGGFDFAGGPFRAHEPELVGIALLQFIFLPDFFAAKNRCGHQTEADQRKNQAERAQAQTVFGVTGGKFFDTLNQGEDSEPGERQTEQNQKNHRPDAAGLFHRSGIGAETEFHRRLF